MREARAAAAVTHREHRDGHEIARTTQAAVYIAMELVEERRSGSGSPRTARSPTLRPRDRTTDRAGPREGARAGIVHRDREARQT